MSFISSFFVFYFLYLSPLLSLSLSRFLSLLFSNSIPFSFLPLKGCSDKTSSFPARTVTCGVVFTYILHLSFLSYNDPTNDGLFVFYMIITILYVFVAFVTSISRVSQLFINRNATVLCVVQAVSYVILAVLYVMLAVLCNISSIICNARSIM